MYHPTPNLTRDQRKTVILYVLHLSRRIDEAEKANRHATVERLVDLRDAVEIALATCDAHAEGETTWFTTHDLNALRKALPSLPSLA
jgi:hypothetical protein